MQRKNNYNESEKTWIDKKRFRKTDAWRSFRRELIQKQDYRCQICGVLKKKGLIVHHRDLDKNHYTDLIKEHFLVLCPACHKYGHKLELHLSAKNSNSNPQKDYLRQWLEEHNFLLK